MAEIIPYLFYRDVPDAIGFLVRAFGFAEVMRTGTPSGGMHAELSLGGSRVMLGQPVGEGHGSNASPAKTGVPTAGVFIYVDDVDAVHERARAAGARIEQAPADHGYGRTFTAYDPDGHPWYLCAAP